MKGGACALVRPLLAETCKDVADRRAGIVERADMRSVAGWAAGVGAGAGRGNGIGSRAAGWGASNLA